MRDRHLKFHEERDNLAAAAAIAATVGVAAPASANYADVDTMVTWVGGDSWLTVDYPGEGVVMESSGAKIVNHSFSAHPGDRIGVDPIMGDADYITGDPLHAVTVSAIADGESPWGLSVLLSGRNSS